MATSRLPPTTHEEGDATTAPLSGGQVLGGSDATTEELSREEMRQRRLAALTGGRVASAENRVASHQQQQQQRTRDTTSAAAVIDLCSSSGSDDDENEKLARGTTQRRSNASTAAAVPRPPRRASDLGTRAIPPAFAIPGNEARRTIDNPYYSNKKRKAQQKQSVSTASSSAVNFRVASYNLWFEEVHQAARMRAVANLLLQTTTDLWLIGFQEVTNSLASQLFPKLKQAGYTVVRQPNVPYGCAVAVYTGLRDGLELLDAGFQPYSHTVMGRGIQYAKVRLPSPLQQQQLLFCTTHLESWCGPHMTGSKERQQQALELQAFAQRHDDCTVVLTGDWNWDDVRPRSVGPDPVLLSHLDNNKWKDAWLECHSDNNNPGYTYDAKTNPMLMGSLRRRFDRVLVSSPVTVGIRSAALMGSEAVAGYTWIKEGRDGRRWERKVAPSDHFGLLVQLDVGQK